MLARLYIRNYALIEEQELLPGKGLNILTGETGAGKSLLLGAIGLILGKRVDHSRIFNPDQKCVVEATFSELPPQTTSELEEIEAFDMEGNEILIRREISSSGKTRAFINDTPVAVAVLKSVAARLVDLHGQHENQQLLSPDNQLGLLDQYAGSTYLAFAFGKALSGVRRTRKTLTELREQEKTARQQLDYYRFQVDELDKAELDPAEEERLDEQIELFQNAEEVKAGLTFGSQALYNDEQSLYNRLSEVLHQLEKGARLNPGIKAVSDKLEEFRYGLQDAGFELDKINADIDHDPGFLQQMTERQDLYNRLKMKFSARDVEELISMREEFRTQLDAFESIEGRIGEQELDLAKQEKELIRIGLELESKRAAAIKGLEDNVNALLREVSLPNAEFRVELERNLNDEGPLDVEETRVKPLATGLNTAAFHIRTNKGMPMGPLAQIASGGEISRVMLAIKAAMAEKAELAVLIFDEIDTGISGETANKVGKVMQKLAAHYQLIAITHLPQIAGKGHSHFQIYKESDAEKTVSRVRKLEKDARILELAKMLSGEHPTASAIKNAKELISSNA